MLEYSQALQGLALSSFVIHYAAHLADRRDADRDLVIQMYNEAPSRPYFGPVKFGDELYDYCTIRDARTRIGEITQYVPHEGQTKEAQLFFDSCESGATRAEKLAAGTPITFLYEGSQRGCAMVKIKLANGRIGWTSNEKPD